MRPRRHAAVVAGKNREIRLCGAHGFRGAAGKFSVS
jgi:hypothetical protein